MSSEGGRDEAGTLVGAKTLKRMLDHGQAITAPRIVTLRSRYSSRAQTTARAFSLLGARPSYS